MQDWNIEDKVEVDYLLKESENKKKVTDYQGLIMVDNKVM